MNSRDLLPFPLLVFLFGISATPGFATPYRVFDWQGKAVPAKPTSGPPGAGAFTQTTYLNGGQYWDGSALTLMNVNVDIAVQIWNNPAKWKIDPEGFVGSGGVATYGYQTPDEAEFNFGDPTGRVVMRFDFVFARPVKNPSFFLMDIDNNGSDHGTLFQATTQGGGTVYPTMSLVSGSTVRWTGSGPTLDVFSGGPGYNDTDPRGDAFFEWEQDNVTGISFVWESNSGTSIRVSNVYAEYDPAGFAFAVPEPTAAMLALLGAGLVLRRRR